MVGHPYCPSDAHESIKCISKRIMSSKGGDGVIRELLDLITNKIPLPQEYHNFADKRIFLGIPNMMNVISNFVFLIPAIIYFKRTKQ